MHSLRIRDTRLTELICSVLPQPKGVHNLRLGEPHAAPRSSSHAAPYH